MWKFAAVLAATVSVPGLGAAQPAQCGAAIVQSQIAVETLLSLMVLEAGKVSAGGDVMQNMNHYKDVSDKFDHLGDALTELQKSLQLMCG